MADGDYKTKYNIAVAIFSIFFIVALLGTIFFTYKVIKHRKILI